MTKQVIKGTGKTKTPEKISITLKDLTRVSKRILKNRPLAIIEDNPETECSDGDYNKDNITSKNQYTFSAKGYYSYYTISYVLQEFVFKQKNLITLNKHTHEYEYDYKQYKEIITEGNIVFDWEDELYNMFIDGDSYSIILKSNADITKLVALLKRKVRHDNPLIGKLFQIRQGRDGFFPIMKRVPKITFKDVILDEKLKEDIYDNTIFQLEHLKENNGVIFYGDPGVGKSLVCSAIANEITKKGYTVAYLSTQVDYTMLNEFIEEFISPCILIFEDIDAFGESRDTQASGLLSDFLQFINGITERDERMIFIATTNYLERLDKAIANRPVRFNRKFEFKYPSDEEMDRLVKLYFDKDIADEFSSLCHNKEFSGSHVKEIQRTVNLLSTKRNQTVSEVFAESVDLVHDNFSPKLNPMGFNGQDKV